jgi:phospholipid/cholesterol/gamma-HCH transport system substrate-binding protein
VARASSASARLIGVGVFVLGALLLFTIGLFMIGDRQNAFARKFVLYTEFSRITGVQPGSIVRVSGAKAGTVTDIAVPTSPAKKFRVRMEISEALHPLVRTDSVAAILTEGLVGGSFLSIGTGSEQAPKAPENSTIPSREPFEIADLLQQMSDTVRKVNETIDLLQDDVQHAVQAVATTVDTANQLIVDITDDVKTMASAGARISGDTAEIADAIRNGKGTIGKFVNDDQFYQRATAIAKSAEDIAGNARQFVQQARAALDSLQSKTGPIQGVTSNLKQTLDDARAAMTGFAENMEALKRNFFFRGFFNARGYFDLSKISPEDYRRGKLTQDGKRRAVRVWLSSAVLFEPDPDAHGERLTNDGKARLDSAIAPFLDRLTNALLIVEGYSQRPTHDEQYIESRARAALAREYLIGKFHLDPLAVGVMPLGAVSPGSPGETPWNGIALAVFLEKE